MDCSINWTNSKTACLSGNEKKTIQCVLQLARKYPDQVWIKEYPKENGAMIIAEFPRKWIKIRPPKKPRYTDEQRRKAAERMKKIRERSSKASPEYNSLHGKMNAIYDS